ncbi:hypothetical protein RRG08_044465 [Elysia crispata]|uniref:Uncharacterized protein n=1 Tax=Elysia crispata TaxID=231223 RepID=A0AAE1DVC5_9GAST|nr:hypothetical protein RRG08_044465 [Elysia crispata]
MLTLTVLLLLVLGTAQAQMNKTCCPPEFSALGYSFLLDAMYDYYHDSKTGDSLSADIHGKLMILRENKSGRLYTRLLSDNNCTYQEFPELVGMDTCIHSNMTFEGAVMLDGKEYYEWHEHNSLYTLHSTILVDDDCVTKILNTKVHGSPVISSVYFNPVPHANVSIVASFDKTGCVKAM